LRWALRNGSDDPTIQDKILKFVFAYEFGWTPEQIEKLTLSDTEALMILLKETKKEQSREEEILKRGK
jgi:hypothetical protein